MNMVGTGATRIALISIDEINVNTVNTSFGAFANKFIRENKEESLLRNHGSSLRDDDVMQHAAEARMAQILRALLAGN